MRSTWSENNLKMSDENTPALTIGNPELGQGKIRRGRFSPLIRSFRVLEPFGDFNKNVRLAWPQPNSRIAETCGYQVPRRICAKHITSRATGPVVFVPEIITEICAPLAKEKMLPRFLLSAYINPHDMSFERGFSCIRALRSC